MRSYAGLFGVFFADPDSRFAATFTSALGNTKIGEVLGKPVDRSQQLAGGIWFYYGSRYGEYLGRLHQADAEDYLPATLERSPARASSYSELAEFYDESGDLARALLDYRHSLDLQPKQPPTHDKIA